MVEQLGLLSNATALANELLPRSALKLLPGIEKSCEGILEKAQVKEADIESTFIPELKDWRQNLRKAVKRLQFHICKYHVKLLLYSADRNELQINPATYLILDVEETKTSLQPDCMPSLVFQVRFLVIWLGCRFLTVFQFAEVEKLIIVGVHRYDSEDTLINIAGDCTAFGVEILFNFIFPSFLPSQCVQKCCTTVGFSFIYCAAFLVC